MNTSSSFVVGQCTRVRDASIFMTVRAQVVHDAIRDLTNMSHKEFPPDGEIELRGARTVLKPEDWALAKPVLEGPPRRQRWVSQSARRLLPFQDLSDLYAPESARRLLVESGLQDGFVGDKIFRIGRDTMIAVTMVKSDDGRCRATAKDMSKLTLSQFKPTKVLVIPTPSGSISLMERGSTAEIGVVNWMSDVQYVEQIVKAAQTAESDEERAIAAIASVLLIQADKLAGRISGDGEPDPKIAHEILRSRRLGELLGSRPALVAEFISALRRTPDISARIESEIERLARDTVAAKRAELTTELTTAVEAEITSFRSERFRKIEAELADLEASSLQELQNKIDREKSAALAAIEIQKANLDKAVTDLEMTRETLQEECRLRTTDISSLSLNLDRLTSEVADRKAEVDRLLRMEQILRDVSDWSTKKDNGLSLPLPEARPTARPITIAAMHEWLGTSQLLTETGRSGVAKLAALILSGDVPIITGPETDDVLEVLSFMVTGGAITTLDCDPTIITYEDLWHRPGNGSLTPLGLALANTQMSGTVRLCAIRRTELSPSHFWIKTLRSAGRQGFLPREFLLCVSYAGDEGTADLKDEFVFQADRWIERNAGIRALVLTDDDNLYRVMEMPEFPIDHPAAVSAIAASQAHLSIAETRWLAKFIPVAKAVLTGDADPFVKEILATTGTNKKSELRLVDKRGPSHA